MKRALLTLVASVLLSQAPCLALMITVASGQGPPPVEFTVPGSLPPGSGSVFSPPGSFPGELASPGTSGDGPAGSFSYQPDDSPFNPGSGSQMPGSLGGMPGPQLPFGSTSLLSAPRPLFIPFEVPEPTAGLLLLGGAIPMLARRRLRRTD